MAACNTIHPRHTWKHRRVTARDRSSPSWSDAIGYSWAAKRLPRKPCYPATLTDRLRLGEQVYNKVQLFDAARASGLLKGC